MGGVYTHGSVGCSVIATDVPIRHSGRVAVFYRPSPQYVVKVIQQFGPNVVSFHLATREQRWYIIRCYLSLNNT